MIVDGDHGQVILNPDDKTLHRYQEELEHHRSLAAELSVLRDLPAETIDGANSVRCKY